jgi:hypothetical protein
MCALMARQQPLFRFLLILAVMSIGPAPDLLADEAYFRGNSSTGRTSSEAAMTGASSGLDRYSVVAGYRGKTDQDRLTIGLGLGLESLDTKEYIVRARGGEETSLEKSHDGKSGFIESEVSYARGPDSVSISGSYSDPKAPFAVRQLAISGRTAALPWKGALKSGISAGTSEQPESYFVDRDYRTKARPTRVDFSRFDLGYEHVFSERSKGEINVFTAVRLQERPRHWGATTKVAYAFSDRVFTRIDFTSVKESRNSPLKNERGYFSFHGVKSAILFEPVYGHIVNASYGRVIETEFDPRVNSDQTYKSDVPGLGLRSDFSGFKIDLSVERILGQKGLTKTNVQGGMIWAM